MRYWIFFISLSLCTACEMLPKKIENLPIMGHKHFDETTGDTVYHTIPDFKFINQDSVIITPKTFEGKAYIVDYFFTSCPTICPVVKKQCLRVAERFKDNDLLKILSVSIDPKFDTIPRLQAYGRKLGIDSKQWYLTTGDKEHIYEVAEDFFHVAKEDPNAPGGFDHDGRLVLIDKNKHIRAVCDGTDPDDVDDFMLEVQWLLNHEYTTLHN